MKTFAIMFISILYYQSAFGTVILSDWQQLRGSTIMPQGPASINATTNDQIVMKWDISNAINTDYKLELVFGDGDTGLPLGIIHMYTWYGPGTVSGGDAALGDLYHSVTGITWGTHTMEIDVTDLVVNGLSSGQDFLAMRLEAGNSDRYGLGPRRGVPDPTILEYDPQSSEIPHHTPIPAPILLLGTGLIGLAWRRK